MRFISFVLIFTLIAVAIGVRVKPRLIIEVDKDVRFDLYTLKNPTEHQVLKINNIDSIIQSNYNPEIPTRIFIHGFQSKGQLKNTLTDAYFNKGEKNVNLIAVNWEKSSNTINYPGARNNVEIIGKYTAKFVDFLVENQKLKLSNLIVIGFSLGAHISGYTGKNVRSGKLPKIVGLDPARPLFSLDKPDERLNSKDADYVETIQTSKLGFFDPLGVVSFYPNGGHVQPGCSWDESGSCSHSTAFKYFAQSVYFDQPLFGDLCNSLDDVKTGKCNADKHAILGGEPGEMQQPAGIYYIRMIPNPDEE